MNCIYPLARVEDNNGRISFHGAYTKDIEARMNFRETLLSNNFVKSVKLIPCGQCTACRLNKSREWANRIMLEAKEYKFNYFVTLTYDDKYVPIKRCYNDDTGEIITGLTLKKEDLEKFNHDLRQHWSRKYNHNGIRYYECGEYGSNENTSRPHYHCIIFNLPNLDDLKVYKITELGQTLYTSETISKIWGKGYVVIGEVTWDSSAYVARYVMKKKFGKEADEYYRSQGKIPEFTTMSRMPGIGRNYYEENKDTIYKTDEIFIKAQKGIIGTKPGKYFDRLYEQDEPEKYKEIKRNREKQNRLNTKLQLEKLKATPNIQKQREIKGRKLEEQIKTLKRDI